MNRRDSSLKAGSIVVISIRTDERRQEKRKNMCGDILEIALCATWCAQQMCKLSQPLQPITIHSLHIRKLRGVKR